MDYTERIKSDIRLRIRQLDYIQSKLRSIPRFSQFTDLKCFFHKLTDEKKKYEERLTPTGWAYLGSVPYTERLAESFLLNNRLRSFVYEVRYETLAVNYHDAFFGFYHPESFLLFGLSPGTVYNFGMMSGGIRDAGYSKFLTALHKDPSLITREREKVTAYIMRGIETSVFKRKGEKFPIDLTIPGGF